MGKRDRKKNDDYWSTDAFEQDQEILTETPNQEEEAAPEPAKGKGKKGQASKTDPPKSSAPKKDEQVDESPKTAPLPAKGKGKKGQASKTEAPKSSAPKKDEQVDESPKAAPEPAKGKGKGKKGQAAKTEAQESPKEEPKSSTAAAASSKKKKGGISKTLQQAILKQKEDEERRKREEEEEEKRREERRKIQAQKEEEERLRKEEEKKKRNEEKRLKNEEKKREQDLQKKQEILNQLTGGNVVLPQTSGNEKDKTKQSQMYATRKKKKNTDSETNSKAQTSSKSGKAAGPSDPDDLLSGEVLESWEDFDLGEENPPQAATSPKAPQKQNNNATSAIQSASATPLVSSQESSSAPLSVSSGSATEAAPQEISTATDKGSSSSLRSPIICILGHVDTGKTKLLDKIRHTNVQEGEAGGITQQIGATWFPMENLEKLTKRVPSKTPLKNDLPGLLVIDTPGHESFSNLRSRGSNLCDIAILVVDIMHGLEPQTLESINLLKKKKTPFVVALNKIDRIYDWKAIPNGAIQETLKQQKKSAVEEYENKVKETIVAFAEQGLNAQLYYKQKSVKEFRSYVSLVPTSAISGEGIPDLLMLLVQLTQRLMAEKLLYLTTLQCTVLEVKVVEGLGTTIDVILVNGVLNEGDQIVVCGMNGPIVTHIRGLLTPQPLKEMRVRGTYQHHKQIKAAMGVKIIGKDLEHAVAGSSLFVVSPNDDIEQYKKEVMQDLENMRKKVNKQEIGVYVQASTLGSLEALLEFLADCKIPVAGINIGPVNKKDVTRASIMIERQKEYAVILAFDVKLNPQAVEFANHVGVQIFRADIIYHLFDQFSQYMENIKEAKKREKQAIAVFPCRLQILKCFNKKSPILLGVKILEGSLRLGTPIVAPLRDLCDLGKITSMEKENKEIKLGKVGDEIAVKLEIPEGEQQKVFDRHFDITDELVSKISRQSLDALKECFREELTKEDVALLVQLKNNVFKFN